MNIMAIQRWIVCGVLFIALAWTASSILAQTLERFSFAEPHLGTIIDLTLYAPEEGVANEAARAAYARVKELDRIFSDYRPDSELMRLCETAGTEQPIKVSPELLQVLQQAQNVAERTDGQFDVTIGPLVKLWRLARKQKRVPSADEIARAKECVGWKWIAIDAERQTVELRKRGMLLDFGGIAKGYIAQDVSRLLREQNLNRTLVAVAGDIVAGDPPPGTDGWKIGVARLTAEGQEFSRMLLLKNRAISTSGDAFQFALIDGVRYSHIVDPQTGLGLTQRSSVTVIARDGAMADALATAVCVLGPEPGMRLIAATDQTAVLIVQAEEQGVNVIESPSFRQFQTK